MAITVYTKEETSFLWGEQASFGTVLADNADFNGTTPEWGEILDCEIVSLDWGVNIREPNRSNAGSRVVPDANYQQDVKGSSPKITINGDAKKATLASFLYAVMQNVSEAAGSPFEKTYTFSTTQPDFTAASIGTGWAGTLIIKQGSSQSLKAKDLICDELTLTCNPNDGQGRMQMSASLMGRGSVSAGANPSGTLARYAQTFYYFHDIKTCTVNGNAIVPLGITLTIKNNAIPIGSNNSGDFLTFALPKYEVTGTIKAVWDTNSLASQVTQDDATSAVPIVLTWGTDDNDGYLTFGIYGTIAPSPDVYDPVKGIDINFVGLYNGTNAPLTVVLADAIDRAW